MKSTPFTEFLLVIRGGRIAIMINRLFLYPNMGTALSIQRSRLTVQDFDV